MIILFNTSFITEFDFPLTVRPRFQLNFIIQRDDDIELMGYRNILNLKITIFHSLCNFVDKLVLPFLWLQNGFSEPSKEIVVVLAC